MTKDVRFKGTLITDVTATGVSIASDTWGVRDNGFSVQANVTKNADSTSNPTGTIKMQASINYEDWVDVDDSSVDISDFASKIWEFSLARSAHYRMYLTLTSTPTAATGTITGSVGVLDIAAKATGEGGNDIEVELLASVAATGTITGSVGVLDIAADNVGVAGNAIQIVLVDGETAGSETIDVTGSVITVGIESGVSTCAQIISAIEGDVGAAALVNLTETTSGAMEADSITLTGGLGDVAGSETVAVTGTTISVYIESGVSTCAQIISAIEGDVDADALVDLTETTSGAMEADSVTLSGGDSYAADFKVWVNN